MKPATECDRARLRLMAALEGETVKEATGPGTDAPEHLAVCSSCRQWLKDVESMDRRFQGVAYPAVNVDLWAAVERRIHTSDPRLPVTHRLWLIGAFVLAWRALELLIDLPFPMLHPLIPLAAAVAALWQIAGDPLAIETFAPELHKRGI